MLQYINTDQSVASVVQRKLEGHSESEDLYQGQ